MAVEALNAAHRHPYDASHAIGMTIGNATILKELARGNMGIVFIRMCDVLQTRVPEGRGGPRETQKPSQKIL